MTGTGYTRTDLTPEADSLAEIIEGRRPEAPEALIARADAQWRWEGPSDAGRYYGGSLSFCEDGVRVVLGGKGEGEVTLLWSGPDGAQRRTVQDGIGLTAAGARAAGVTD